MSPVFGHGALRLYLLSLLAEAPRHGYELMQALEHRFGGTYSPSAGTIYPRLAKLEEEGLVTKVVDGRKATYEITDAGRAELRARESELHALETEITDSVRRLASDVRASVRSAMQGLRADLAEAEREARTAAKRAGTASRHADRAARPASAPSAPSASAASAPTPSAPSGGGAPSAPGAPDAAASDRFDASARERIDNPWAPSAPSADRSDASGAAERAASRMAVHEIDLALSGFRQDVREAARRRGEDVTAETAQTVRHELEAALLRIKSVLG